MSDTIQSSFISICDLVRYGTTRFQEAGLVYGHGTDNALDEVIFMVLEALHLPIDNIDPFWNARLTDAEKSRILAFFEERITTRKPASYLLNKAYMHGLPFYVDERVIVPRSYIAEILRRENSPVQDPETITTVLDLCTGSGCLGIFAAHLFPHALVDITDLSAGALAVAEKNIHDYGLEERMTRYQGSLFDALPAGKKYDLIITNPPYVDKQGMDALPPEYRAEPAMALGEKAGEDGLDLVRPILERARHYLNEGGALICELGRCGPALEAAYPDIPFLWLETENSTGEVFWLEKDQLPG